MGRNLTVKSEGTTVHSAVGSIDFVGAGVVAAVSGVDATVTVASLVRAAAEVPSGAPAATELPIAIDTTASTGGLYVWTGAAWVKGSTIP